MSEWDDERARQKMLQAVCAEPQAGTSRSATTSMRRADVLALAARVEALTGPDRAVDAEIACVVEGLTFRKMLGVSAFRTSAGDRGLFEVRHYTASLDAAASLVPAGWSWGRFHSGVFECFGETPSRIFLTRGEAATPALALTAAALRAIAEGMSDAG